MLFCLFQGYHWKGICTNSKILFPGLPSNTNMAEGKSIQQPDTEFLESLKRNPRTFDLYVKKVLQRQPCPVPPKVVLGCAAYLNKSPDVIEKLGAMCGDLGENALHGNPALHSAAEQGHIPVIHKLLGMGAPINALNEKSVTALYTAVCSRQMETVSVLCLSRADLEVKDAEGKTALHHVCSNSSDIGIATLLVQSGADINSIDAFGHTPFEMAMAAGNVAMMKLMVESGTKPPGTRASKYVNKCRGVRGRKELWELMMAKGWGSPDTATTTIDAIRLRSVEAAPDVSSTAASSLHVSVKNGDVGAVAKILSTGGDPNALDARGRTPLHLAAELGHVEVVEELLKGKANMEIRDIISHTPLHSAVEAQRVAVIEVLIAGGASLGREDEQGKTPLHIACKLDYTDIISTLLDAGAIPSHRRNELLQSPLFVACEAGSIGAVRQLLPRLSVRQINIFDRVREEIKGGKPMLMGGDTALMAAVRSSRNQLEIVRALINAGADTAIFSLSSQCSAVDMALENDAIALNPSLGPAVLRELVTADVNEVGSDGCMVLHHACRLGACGEVILALVDMGADVQEPCVGLDFFPPLILAAVGGNPDALEVLLGLPECGGLNARGPLPMRPTALACAVVYGCTKAVRFLLEEGADMSLMPIINGSPMPLIKIATERGFGDITCLLVQARLLKHQSERYR